MRAACSGAQCQRYTDNVTSRGFSKGSTDLVLLHHGHRALKRFQPSGRGIGDEVFLEGGDALVGAAHGKQAVAVLGVVLEVLAVADHGAPEVADGQALLLVVERLAPPTQPLDVRIHGFLEAVGTVEPEAHLELQHLELVRHGGLGLGPHLLARPLEGAVYLLGDMHRGGSSSTLHGRYVAVVVIEGIRRLGVVGWILQCFRTQFNRQCYRPVNKQITGRRDSKAGHRKRTAVVERHGLYQGVVIISLSRTS